MTMITDRFVVSLAILLGAVGPNAMAQAERTDTLSNSAYCARAAAMLDRGASGEAYYRALSDIQNCGGTGAVALRKQWQQPPTDTIALRLLGEVSPQLRDRHLLDAVLTAFRDASRPRDVRFAALEALVGYYEPGLGLAFSEPHIPVQHGSAYVALSFGDPSTTEPGPTPLTARARHDILQALQQAGTSDPDQRMRLIAKYLHSCLVDRS
jgi:hypothetical protein